MGDDKTSQILFLEDALPELLLSLDIQRAGEIVEDDEFGFTDEHARGRGSLRLSTRKFHATRADQSFEIIIHLLQVTIHDGQLCSFVYFVVRAIQAEQDVVSQCIAKQARNLSGVCTSWRDEKIAGG